MRMPRTLGKEIFGSIGSISTNDISNLLPWTNLRDAVNNVLLVKIEGPGAGIPSIIIYLLLKGVVQTPLLINQPIGKGHLWMPSVNTLPADVLLRCSQVETCLPLEMSRKAT